MLSLQYSSTPESRLKKLSFMWNTFFAQKQSGLKGEDDGIQLQSAAIKEKMWRAVPPLPPEEALSSQELHNLLTAKARVIYEASLKNSFIPTLPIYDDSFLLSGTCDQNLICDAQPLYDCKQKIFSGKITPSLKHVKIKLEDFFCYSSKGIPKQEVDNETKIVGIFGDAGSGKTALMHVILKKIVEEGLYNVDFVFYIHIQDVDFKKEMSLTEFLFSSLTCHWISDQDWHQDFLNHLNKSHKAMILIDGLDEMNFELSHPEIDDHKFSRSSIVLPHVYIKDLLIGKLLPNARIIVTARPDVRYYCFLTSRPCMLVSVIGITEDCQQKIFKSICGKFQTRVFDHVRNDKNTSSLCYSPLFCTLISHCVNIQLKLNVEVDTFDSITKVFVVLLELLIQHSQSFTNSDLKQICEVAWRKISNLDNFQVDGYEKKELALGCNSLNGFKIVCETSEHKFMQHLMLEEFFAALKLFENASANQLQKDVADISCNRFQSVAKFVFGFCNFSVCSRLAKIGDFLLESGLNDVEVFNSTKFYEIPSHLSDLSTFAEWAYETQDEIFAKKCGSSFTNKLLIRGKIIPYDYTPLHYWLQVRKMAMLEVEIYHVEFLENSFVQVFENLCLMGEYIHVCMKKILIDSWKFSDEDMQVFSKCLMSVELLSFSRCEINLSQIIVLSQQLQHCHSLEEFDISGTILDDEAALVLSSCIQYLNNLKKLYISSYCLSSSGMKCLCDAISCKSICLKQLCFSNVTTRNLYSFSFRICAKKESIDSCLNSVRGKRCFHETEDLEINLKMEILSTCLNNVEELDIDMAYSLANVDEGFQMLCEGIKKLEKPLTSLTVRRVVTLGDCGCKSLSCCLGKISSLVYSNYLDKYLTIKGVEDLCHAFYNLNFPMHKFVFHCPDYIYENVSNKFKRCKDQVLELLILDSCGFGFWLWNHLQHKNEQFMINKYYFDR